MNFDDLKKTLQTLQHEDAVDAIDLEQVRRKIAGSRRTFDLRDLREYVACIVVFVLFAPCVFMDYPAMTRVGAVITCLAAVFIGGWMYLGKRRHRSRPELSVDEFLGAEIAHLNYQIWLLRNVSWWYLAPVAVGFLVFVWGLTPVSTAIFMSAGYFAMDRFINAINQFAVKRDLIPRRDELARVRQSLNESNDEAMSAQNKANRKHDSAED